MAALGHKDPRSSIRYQHADLEVVRAARVKLPPLRTDTGTRGDTEKGGKMVGKHRHAIDK